MSTTVEYTSQCHYFNANGELQTSTTCKVNYGTLGTQGGFRYIVFFPDGVSEVEVRQELSGKTTTNGIESEVATAGGNVAVATVEGEVFVFKSSP